jgi:hypothetical protein
MRDHASWRRRPQGLKLVDASPADVAQALVAALQSVATALGPPIAALGGALGPVVAALGQGIQALAPSLGPLGQVIASTALALAPLLPDRYISVGDVPVARLVADHRKQWRVLTLPFVAVAAPAGPAQGVPGTRWKDLCNRYPTWDDLTAAGLTWKQVEQGQPGGGVAGRNPAPQGLADHQRRGRRHPGLESGPQAHPDGRQRLVPGVDRRPAGAGGQ